MDLSFSRDDELFRQEVRDFISDSLPADVQARAKRNWMHSPKDDVVLWHKRLHAQGWVAPSWPKQYGGPGWSLTQRYIFEEETARQHCPRISPFGITMVGPVIYTFGTEAQKARYLPAILSGDEFWCQGYSEPGAGSDLAALSTKAERRGAHYVVNGQKTWTSGAHKADRMFCLVKTRSEGKPQAGISFLLMDMTSPGISVEPIVSMDEDHYLNNVFLENVEVPVEDLIGNENEGWTYAKFLLGNERTGIAGVGRSKTRIGLLKDMATHEFAYGSPLSEDPDFRRRVA
ncbi:MAG: acyl-CoA dehydrogenase family protein, partial [Gammaproteobacteria bacterium]|nr:acyl-CoA dehydrogenase family protein [Gammaproteobacteria bacterium]